MFKKNYITTIAGQLLGIVNAYIISLDTGALFTWKGFIAYAIPAVIGLLTKDFNTTGVGNEAKKASEVPTA